MAMPCARIRCLVHSWGHVYARLQIQLSRIEFPLLKSHPQPLPPNFPRGESWRCAVMLLNFDQALGQACSLQKQHASQILPNRVTCVTVCTDHHAPLADTHAGRMLVDASAEIGCYYLSMCSLQYLEHEHHRGAVGWAV